MFLVLFSSVLVRQVLSAAVVEPRMGMLFLMQRPHGPKGRNFALHWLFLAIPRVQVRREAGRTRI